MVWFFEREAELLVYEVRRDDSATAYESEIAGPSGPPVTRRFSSPTELIDSYLKDQAQLRANGWRPRAGDIVALG